MATGSNIGGMIASTAVGRLGVLPNHDPAIFAATAIPVSTIDVAGSVQNDLVHPTQAFGVHAVDLVTHLVVWDAPLNSPPSSPVAVVGNAVYMGSGTTENAPPLNALSSVGGVWAFQTTP